jgi:hypothetical protein
MMPPILEAVRAWATLGEISDTLASVGHASPDGLAPASISGLNQQSDSCLNSSRPSAV